MTRSVTSPLAFFGHTMGEDRKIARWDKIIDYFHLLAKESDRIQVTDMGPSTEGNPFLLSIISSPENLAKLDHYRQVNAQITDPRGLTEDAVKALVNEGKAVILQSMSLHATEIGGTQMAPELAYDLLSRDCEETQRILDNVIFLMVPCFNPDGQIMVTDWYNRWVGTEYEGCSLPWLYHKYTGHDNNRDAFMQNIVESQYMAKLLFRDWRPQAFQDHHHMGSYGARLYVAPYSEPIRPEGDPLVWRELSWYGAHMAYRLEEEGKTGILNGAQFPGWGHYGFHWITIHHNIAGMLTESASAKLATPLYIHPTQLEGARDKSMPEYAAQTNFPHPWEGGWWRLRDIVEQQKIAAWALLDIAARNKDIVLWNAYLKAKRQTERGAAGKPYAYVVEPEQHDPLTARKLVQLLLNQGIEVKVAERAFRANGKSYPQGTYVVMMQQPKRGVIKNLLGRTLFPLNYFNTGTDGSPRVFDTASDTVAEYMGVDVRPIERKFSGRFSVVCELGELAVPAVVGQYGYILDGRLNDSFTAINRLLKAGIKVWRLDAEVELDGEQLPAGSFYVESGAGDPLLEVARELGISVHTPAGELGVSKHELKPLRVGMYQRFFGGNADEGWTRLVLEKFEFPYVTVNDAEIKAGNLNERFDVLIFPNDRKQMVVDITKPDKSNPFGGMIMRWLGNMPPEYRSGIGDDGVKAVKAFVEAGGRLVAMNRSCDLAIDLLGLRVRNLLDGLDAKAFYTHGSTLHAQVKNGDALGYGMPDDALVFHWDSPAFAVTDTAHAEDYRVIVEYPMSEILQSGILVGEEKIRGKAAMVAAKKGQGEAVLIGFWAQHRAQTHGTFKLLFNTMYR